MESGLITHEAEDEVPMGQLLVCSDSDAEGGDAQDTWNEKKERSCPGQFNYGHESRTTCDSYNYISNCIYVNLEAAYYYLFSSILANTSAAHHLQQMRSSSSSNLKMPIKILHLPLPFRTLRIILIKIISISHITSHNIPINAPSRSIPKMKCTTMYSI
jgi:hypothetical protein